MSLSKAVLRTAVLLLLLWVALITSSSSSSTCPLACLCERGPHINCSSLGLQIVPAHIPVTVRTLNLSHNALRSLPPLWPSSGVLGVLGHLWLDQNNMESLSLCVRRVKAGLKTSARDGCVSWAPALEQLSAEENQMHQVPKGLGGSTNLRVLQLSHNRISALGPSDFQGCGNLRELHLQNNLIKTIHPLAFKDLQELQVLDLRFNLLTTMPSPVFLSLLNLGAQVDLDSNRWRCDCNLRAMRNSILQKHLDQTPESWRMVCSSPLHHAGKQLHHLMDQDLTCPSPGHGSVDHFDEAAEMGSQVLLPCGPKDKDCSQALWWTPHGQVTGTQHGLLVTDITEMDAGLYVCVSGQQEEQVSVFDLHVIQETASSRLRRAAQDRDSILEAKNNRNQMRAATKTQAQFDLAVSLSVIITFIVAFIIGVLVRPCFDKLWRKIRSKKSSVDPPEVQTVNDNSYQEPPIYDNEGFEMVDEPAQVRVGQRVTFSDVTEPIYPKDDNDDASSESSLESERPHHNDGQNSVVVENIETQQQSSRAAQEPVEPDLPDQQESEASERGREMEYEPIPDPEEHTKDTSSISSASSTGDKDQVSPDIYENVPHTNQKMEEGEPPVDDTPEQTGDQQSPVVKPVAVPVFDSEPFPEWATQLMEKSQDPTRDLDPELWNDSGESFSFTDGSERSSMRDKSHSQPAGVTGVPLPAESDIDVALPQPKPHMAQDDAGEVHDDMGYDEMSRRSSSTDSVDSGDEPTEYTVNPDEDDDDEEEENTLAKTLTPNVPSQCDSTVASSRQDDILGNRARVDTIILEPDDIKFTMINDSSDQGPFDEDPFLEEDPEGQTRSVASQLPSYPARPDRFSSSEGEEEPKKYNVHPAYRRRPVLISTNSESFSERASLSSADEEEPTKYRPHTNTMPEIESRPIIINTSSPRAPSDLPTKRPDRVLNINFDNSATNTDDLGTADTPGRKSVSFEPPGHPPLPSTSTVQIEGIMAGVSLDQIPSPKRALVFGIKDSADHKPVTDQRQSNLSSLSGAVVMPDLTGSQVSSQPKLSTSSQHSASSDENDDYATSTDHLDITTKKSSVLGPPSHPPPLPPSQFQSEGMMAGVSLDQIPLAKRALDIRVKDSVADFSGSQVTSQPRLSVSSQGSASSDEKDDYATNPHHLDITTKKSSVSGLPNHPPPSQLPIEGMMGGVSVDKIPLAKRALDIRVKDSVDHQQLPASDQKQSNLSSLSGAVDFSPRHPAPPPPSQYQTEGIMAGVSLDEIPLAKKALDIRVKDSVPDLSDSAVSRQPRPSVPSRDSASSDESDDYAKSSLSRPPSHPPPPPPSQLQGEGITAGVSLDQIPLAKKALDIRVKDSVDHQQLPASDQKLSNLSSLSGAVVRPPSRPEPPPSQYQTEDMMAGVSLDQIPLAKRALDIRVKDSVDQKQVLDTDRRQSNLSSLSETVDLFPRHPAPPPPSQYQREGMMAGVSLDEIPLAKRALDIRVKDSVTDLSGSHVSREPRPSVPNYDYPKSSLSGPPSHPPPPPPSQLQREGIAAGVSLDQIPLAKKALDIRVKDSVNHQQSPASDQKLSNLSSLSGAVVRPPSQPEPPPSEYQTEGIMAGVSLGEIPLAKRALDIRVKDSVPDLSDSAVSRQPRPIVLSRESASSDESDDYAKSSLSGPPSHPPPPPPSQLQREGITSGVSLDQIPLAKRALDIRVKDTVDHKQENDTKTQMNIPIDRLPRPKKTLLFTSPMDDPMILRDTTAVQHEPEMPNLNASYKVHRQSISSVSSQDSASPAADDYKGGNSVTFDHFPKPKTSLLFRSSNNSASSQQRLANNVEAEPNTPYLKGSPQVSLSTNASTEKVDEFSQDHLPMPKRYLQFTVPRDAAMQERGQLVENHQGQRASLSEHTPEAERKLLGLNYSSKFTTSTEGTGRDDQFSLDHLPTVKRTLAFSYSADTTAKTDLPVDAVIARKQSASSVSSVGSDHSMHDDSTQEENYALDGLPLPKRSLKFTTMTPDAVGPPTSTYQSSLTRQTDATRTLSGISSTDLYSRPEETTSVLRTRAMDGFTSSFQRSTTSSGQSTGGRASLSSYGAAIPFHSDHAFRSVSTGSPVITTTTRTSPETTDVGDTLPVLQRPRRIPQFGIRKDDV